MKKIALVMGHFGPKSGGVLSSVINLIDFLGKSYKIHVFAGRDKFKIPYKILINRNIIFTFFSIKHKGFFKIPEYNLDSKNFNDYDIIWFHGAYMSWNKIAKNINTKYIYTPHGGFSNLLNVDFLRLLRRFFLFFSEYYLIKNAQFIQALSKSEKFFLQLINPNTKEIPNYIFKKKKIIYKKKNKNFCYIGRLDPQKNIPFLIKIIETTNIKIDFYGYFTKSSTTYEKNYIKTKKEFRKNFYGSYTGERQLSKILQKYNFMILPSKWEGMPIVIFEAIENGVTPIISNNITVPNFLKNFVIRIDTSNFKSSIKLINYLNFNCTKKYRKFSINAINACKKRLNGSMYKVILDI